MVQKKVEPPCFRGAVAGVPFICCTSSTVIGMRCWPGGVFLPVWWNKSARGSYNLYNLFPATAEWQEHLVMSYFSQIRELRCRFGPDQVSGPVPRNLLTSGFCLLLTKQIKKLLAAAASNCSPYFTFSLSDLAATLEVRLHQCSLCHAALF